MFVSIYFVLYTSSNKTLPKFQLSSHRLTKSWLLVSKEFLIYHVQLRAIDNIENNGAGNKSDHGAGLVLNARHATPSRVN